MWLYYNNWICFSMVFCFLSLLHLFHSDIKMTHWVNHCYFRGILNEIFFRNRWRWVWWTAGPDVSTAAALIVDLCLNSCCLSHSCFQRAAYLRDFNSSFLFHLHLKSSDMPKGTWISERRPGKSITVISLFHRHERECHNKLATQKYFRRRERVRILITQLSSLVDPVFCQKMTSSAWQTRARGSLRVSSWACFERGRGLAFMKDVNM